ncbi:TrkH family potassium uptake protein [Verrucomicrobiaceae bacterium 227]
MNITVLLRSLGTMVLLLGIAMGISVLLAAIVPVGEAHETGLNLGGWALSLSIALTLGAGLWLAGHYFARKAGRGSAMRRREAMALVGAGWFFCSIVGALPYVFCEPYVPFFDAFFEAVSGLTTTGSTIFSDLEQLPRTILVWRSTTQWLGGMGILAMFVVVLSGMTASSKTLIGAESSLANSDIASLRQTMRQLWGIYSIFTLICFLGLWAFGLTPFQAMNYALTAVSTGGFGTENDSVGPLFSGGSKIWLTCFMLMGAMSFPFYLTLLKRRFVDLRVKFEEIVWYLIFLFVISGVLIAQSLTGHLEVGVIDIIFNVVSVSTTTGYVSSDYDSWSRVGVALLILLMIVGGCSGSTAGGLKMSRMIFWFRFVSSGLERSFRPKVVSPIKLAGRQVADDATDQLFLVLSLFGFFGITGTLLFQLFDPGHSLMGAMSAVISCLGNVGPAFAEMGPTENFSGVSPASKTLFACLMILGRLEYVALLVLFSRQLWKRY